MSLPRPILFTYNRKKTCEHPNDSIHLISTKMLVIGEKSWTTKKIINRHTIFLDKKNIAYEYTHKNGVFLTR